MGADSGKQPGYGSARFRDAAHARRTFPDSRILNSSSRSLYLGQGSDRGRTSRRNFGIPLGVGRQKTDDGAAILNCGVASRRASAIARSRNRRSAAKEQVWQYFEFQKKIEQFPAWKPLRNILEKLASIMPFGNRRNRLDQTHRKKKSLPPMLSKCRNSKRVVATSLP